MSTTTTTKPFHHRTDSGELDVFEAARYFSGTTETEFSSRYVSREQQRRLSAAGKQQHSLDIPIQTRAKSVSSEAHEKPKKEKIFKQPISPGGKISSFLNSLFNQASSKKKKSSKSVCVTTDKDEENETMKSLRRRRRSSISELKFITTTARDSTGFRTPPPYAHTPMKSYKDFRSFSDHKLAEYKPATTKTITAKPNYVNNFAASVDEAFEFRYEKHRSFGYLERGGIREKDNFEKFVDDGCESDSSSDLFELRNCDLSYSSSGLPVYESTRMDCIKKGAAPICNGSMKVV